MVRVFGEDNFDRFESYKGRMVSDTQRVQVYRNLNKGRGLPVYSVKDAHSGLVLGHSKLVILRNVIFSVSPVGRQKVIDTGHKNVHAYATGNYAFLWQNVDKTVNRVIYDPYKHKTFVLENTLEPVYKASQAIIGPNGVYIV